MSGYAWVASCIVAITVSVEAIAHGGGNWHEFTIERVNDEVHGRIVRIQQDLTTLIRGQSGDVSASPAEELTRTRDELIEAKEQVEEILEHYAVEGVNVHAPQVRRAQPIIGRTMAANSALEAGIGILNRAIQLDDRKAFIEEFYSQQDLTHLFQLLESHRDRMELYEIVGDGLDESQQTGQHH